MLHPILETLFFLKIARESVCDSIKASNVNNKSSLINYIRNEASDYEVMHLLTLGEMPEEKFNIYKEEAVWGIFKEAVILNSASLRKDMLKEDIMNIVYEMGPVSQAGYSSAAPILEFDRANGRLDLNYLNEENRQSTQQAPAKKNVDHADKALDKANPRYAPATPNVEYNDKKIEKEPTTLGDRATWAARDAKKALEKGANAASGFVANNKLASGAAAGALGAAGLYGLYKLYKGWRAKKAAAKTPEQKAAAEKGMAKVQAKIKAKKGKKK